MRGMLLGAALALLGLALGFVLATKVDAVAEAKWWDLMTAFGTVGAVVVALVIAERTRRQQVAESRAKAGLAAASVAVHLASVRIDLGVAVRYSQLFTSMDPRPEQMDDICEEVERVNAMAIPYEELLALAPLPNDCAEKISAAFACIRLVHARLLGRRTEVKRWVGEERMNLLRFCHEQLEFAENLLKQANDDCARATRVKVYVPDEKRGLA
ncbi:hypothetical protein [Achromobacter sp. DH1f]|uniref:hypothetical protein n=1 Tax=Achromobacter sp. DH1f TaxID=1397275 RepID=UPI00046865A2|nr:hypothetical protein [Achromobacter sp. DH1f]